MSKKTQKKSGRQPKSKKEKKRFFSGIQPTGEIHIGNYLGAIARWVELTSSGEYEGILCIVDYHAITIPYDHKILQERIIDAAAMLMACGIGPDNALLFVQSQVPEHTELAWIFNCVATMGELSRMTQFKDKSEGKENVSIGLFDYPVLQIADILLYKAKYVPVGEDQLQHLELVREVTRRFNKRFEEIFPEPQALLGEAKRILGTDGNAKMSKSLGNTIALADPPEVIRKKLGSAKTDERRQRKTDPGIPTDCNVFTSYHQYFSSQEERDQIDKKCRTAEIGCVKCKKMLLKNIESKLGPIRERYLHLKENPEEVENFLNQSAKKCRSIAKKTMEETKKVIGIR